ncbi:MAG: signal recognition particle-docking protein FtsY [Peptostreptococcaceae bacterium]|nr:signal recognition particle-docking protein FtsY [Peptostreptococcaceae bacterium]
MHSSAEGEELALRQESAEEEKKEWKEPENEESSGESSIEEQEKAAETLPTERESGDLPSEESSWGESGGEVSEEALLEEVLSEDLPSEDLPPAEADSSERGEEEQEESPMPEEPEEESPQTKGKGLFARLKEGLSKTAQSLTGRLDQLFQGHIEIDEELYEEIEEILITADVGFDTTLKIVDQLRTNIRKKSIQDVPAVREELKAVIAELLVSEESRLRLDPAPAIMVIVGVNGVGKTTSIGKIAMKLRREGRSVMLAAADTFRAAAAEQLSVWADRAGVDIVKHQEGADPSAVIFDAIRKAKANKTQVLICDTAGRLHNKKNLMQELAKIFRIIEREYPQAKREVLLVIDATTGQNAVTQAKLFKEAAPLDGIILTKLDGTAKGGVVLSIRSDLQIPIKLIGVGEKIEDLQDFDAESFARALFGNGEE